MAREEGKKLHNLKADCTLKYYMSDENWKYITGNTFAARFYCSAESGTNQQGTTPSPGPHTPFPSPPHGKTAAAQRLLNGASSLLNCAGWVVMKEGEDA